MRTYIIEARNGMAKIGSAFNPRYRCSTLSPASPVQLRLVAAFDDVSEAALHRRFVAYREHNEWFKIEGDFKTFFDERFGQGLKNPVEPWIVDWAAFYSETKQKRAAKFRATLRENRSALIAVHQKVETAA